MTAEGGVPAAEPWDHPQWGRFTFNGYAWVGTVPAPGFDAFVFENGYDPPTPPTGNYELMFSAEDGSDVPSAAAVAVAAAVLTHHAELASRVTAALWDDFNGRGPDSGMWWHDALDEVSEGIEPAPQGPDDLLGRMRLRRIVLWKTAYR
ncbi:MAG: hypothetical protein H7Z41_13030, partial [Cytophagales bacterium]|nr:hypothetical protein [Armatimonadota bacterium]